MFNLYNVSQNGKRINYKVIILMTQNDSALFCMTIIITNLVKLVLIVRDIILFSDIISHLLK
jgi:hypothetical protein